MDTRHVVAIIITVFLVGIASVLIVIDGARVWSLNAIEHASGVTTAEHVRTYEKLSGRSGAVRYIAYEITVNGKRYAGNAKAGIIDTTQPLSVRYIPDNPSANLPAEYDFGTDRGLAQLRLILLAAFVALVVAFYAFHKKEPVRRFLLRVTDMRPRQ